MKALMRKLLVNLALNSSSDPLITERIGEFICRDLVLLSIVQNRNVRGVVSFVTEGKYESQKKNTS